MKHPTYARIQTLRCKRLNIKHFCTISLPVQTVSTYCSIFRTNRNKYIVCTTQYISRIIYLVPSREKPLCGKPCHCLIKGKNYLCRKPYICYSIFNPSWIREPSVTYSHKTHKGKFWESLNHLLYHITLVKPDSFFSDQHAILWSQCLLHFHVI